MNSREYNGWTNYETWVVNLWLNNDQGTYDHWQEVAKNVYNHQARDNTTVGMTRMDEAVYLLADRLKDDHHQAKDEILENMKLESSLWADLIGSALDETNWREIAEHLLEDVIVEA